MTAARRQEIAWRILLASFLCCVLEGALRKWVVSEDSLAARAAYLSKYACMAIFLVIHVQVQNKLAATTRQYLQFGLCLIALGALFSSFYGFNLEGAILSACNFILLPYAAWQAGQLLPRDGIVRFARVVVLVALAMAPLGVVQFYSPKGSQINRYISDDEVIATSGVSDRVRATGTFSYIAGFSEFGMTSVWASLLVVSMSKSPRWRQLGYAGLLAGLVCTFVTVSRASALISLGFIGIWAIAGGGIARKWQGVLALGVLASVAVVSLGMTDTATEIANTVYQRHKGSGHGFLWRLWYTFILPLDAIILVPLGTGFGLEVGGQFGSGTARAAGSVYESAWGRTVNQIGVLGLTGMLLTWALAFLPGIRVYGDLPNGGLRSALAVTLAALGTRAIIGYQFNHVTAYFFWSMAACVLALGNTNENQIVQRKRTATSTNQSGDRFLG